MRHLGSLLLSLLLTPVIYVLAGIGQVQLVRGIASDAIGTKMVGVLALVAAGVALAALLLPRLSPVGLLVGGLMLVAAEVWLLFAPYDFADVLNRPFLGTSGVFMAPAQTGVALLVAIPLLLTATTPRRWRRTAEPAAPGPQYPAAAPPYGPPSGFPPPSLYPPGPAPVSGTPADDAGTRPLFPAGSSFAPSGFPPPPPSSAPPAGFPPPPPSSPPPAGPPPLWATRPGGPPYGAPEPPADPDATRRM